MLGVCIDLYAVGPAFIGVDFLGQLCQKTGGACNYYPVLEEAALPQVRDLSPSGGLPSVYLSTGAARSNAA